MNMTRGLYILLLVLVSSGLVGFKGDESKVSDLQVETTIMARLKDDGRVNAKKIVVESKKLVVTLTGTVSTPEEKHLAERIAGSTKVGVSRIINLIKVTPVQQ